MDMVQYLASRECNGRRTGTPGGIAARNYLVDQMMRAGLQPFFGKNGYLHHFSGLPDNLSGANILGFIPGIGNLKNKYILVDAHYDHLGQDKTGLGYYPGADDNASSIATILHTAKIIFDFSQKESNSRRSIIFSFFDAEEPPYFKSEHMGADHFCKDFPEIVENIDLAIVLDLMGHRMGEGRIPEKFQEIFFIAGTEKTGLSPIVDRLAHAVPGLSPMRIGMHGVPPSGDYIPLRKFNIPFIFLSSGKFKDYHTPFDTAEKLDYEKLQRVSEYLAILLGDIVSNSSHDFYYDRNQEDDLSTLSTMRSIFLKMEEEKIPNYSGIMEFLNKSIADANKGIDLDHNERSKIKYLLEIIARYMI